MPLSNCLACGHPLRGRSDKKFCNDYCRSAHHYQRRREEAPCIGEINRVLQHNYRLLRKALAGKEKRRVPRAELLQSGYRFSFHTHTVVTARGNRFSFCYDHGFRLLPGNRLLLVKSAKVLEGKGVFPQPLPAGERSPTLPG
jgi:predicted nucleic acid-binding Zn ribbon protein